MWRLWNKLFGWDYVVSKGKVCRIHNAKNGVSYIVEYTSTQWMEDYVEHTELSTINNYIWLTCKPEKYLK